MPSSQVHAPRGTQDSTDHENLTSNEGSKNGGRGKREKQQPYLDQMA